MNGQWFLDTMSTLGFTKEGRDGNIHVFSWGGDVIAMVEFTEEDPLRVRFSMDHIDHLEVRSKCPVDETNFQGETCETVADWILYCCVYLSRS